LLVSPLADELFHRAIVESGCYATRSMSEARDHAEELIEAMVVADGLSSEEEAGAFLDAQGLTWVRDYLYGKTTAELMEPFASEGFPLSSFKPARDGVVVQSGAEQDLISGDIAHVPLIIGANRDEQKLFYANLAGMTEVEYNTYMRLLFGDDVDAVEALYPRDTYDPATPYNQFTDILDMTFEPICSEYLAWLVSPFQPTWLYHFRYDRLIPPYDYVFGAAHGFELPFVFDRLDGALYPPEYETEREALRDVVIGYWRCMAHTGRPNCDQEAPGVPTWPEVGQSDRSSFQRVILDDQVETEVLPDINVDRINFWLEYYETALPLVPY